MEQLSYMRSVVDRNVVIWPMTVCVSVSAASANSLKLRQILLHVLKALYFLNQSNSLKSAFSSVSADQTLLRNITLPIKLNFIPSKKMQYLLLAKLIAGGRSGSNFILCFLILDYAGGLKGFCYFSVQGMTYMKAIFKYDFLVTKCYQAL